MKDLFEEPSGLDQLAKEKAETLERKQSRARAIAAVELPGSEGESKTIVAKFEEVRSSVVICLKSYWSTFTSGEMEQKLSYHWKWTLSTFSKGKMGKNEIWTPYTNTMSISGIFQTLTHSLQHPLSNFSKDNFLLV